MQGRVSGSEIGDDVTHFLGLVLWRIPTPAIDHYINRSITLPSIPKGECGVQIVRVGPALQGFFMPAYIGRLLGCARYESVRLSSRSSSFRCISTFGNCFPVK